MSDPTIAGSIGPEHDAFVELLAAYLDEELAQDERIRLDAHLADCVLCQRDLRAQAAIRARLNREAESPVALDVTERVMSRLAHLHTTPVSSAVSDPPSHRRRYSPVLAWSGWGIAAVLAGLLLWTTLHKTPVAQTGMSMAMGPTTKVSLDPQPGPMSVAVLEQFHLMDESDLPTTADVGKIKRELPFSVPALHSPHMRLISAWTTELGGEPAAAIAYRCHDRLVIQYIVSERQFFRHPQVRRAVAQQGVYAVSNGTVTTVAWPNLDSGSFLVGQFTAAELAAMRL
ncbi:MAG: anti-sigma factor [Gemmatimonadota bacterium]